MKPDTTTYDTLDAIIAARLSRKTGKYQGIGIETQDEYSRDWANGQQDIKTIHGIYRKINIVDTVPDVKSGRVAPWDRKNLKPWVTRHDWMGRYQAVIAFKNDRLSRGAWEDEVRIRQWASDNGKVLIIVDGPQWPPRDEGDFWSWTAMAKQAEKEWEAIQERNLRFQGKLRQDGKLVGGKCFGYDIVGEEYDKTLVPNDIGRRYVPEIFQRIKKGETLAQVADWINGKGIAAKPWPPKRVSQLIRNRTYMGQRVDLKGRVVLEVEPLVDAKLWTRANDRLANSPVGRRGPVTGTPAKLSGALFCPRCPRGDKYAPMYRNINTPPKGNGERYLFVYYRCVGHYPERKGCGNMVNLEATDQAAVMLLSQSDKPWKEPRLIEGENHDIELTEIQIQLDDLSKRHLPRAEEVAEREALWARQDRLASLPNIPDRWEDVEFCATCGGTPYAAECKEAGHPKVTVGQHFMSLDRDGQRQMILDDVEFFAEPAGMPGKDKSIPVVSIKKSRLFTAPVSSATWDEGEGEA